MFCPSAGGRQYKFTLPSGSIGALLTSFALPSGSIGALLRCRLHRLFRRPPSSRFIRHMRNSIPEPVSPASSPDGSIGALLRCRLHRLFRRFLRLTSSATGGVLLRNLASSGTAGASATEPLAGAVFRSPRLRGLFIDQRPAADDQSEAGRLILMENIHAFKAVRDC